MDLVAAVFLLFMYLVTLIRAGASPGPGECVRHLHLTWTWRFWSAPETTLDLVTVVSTWASPGFGDSGPHLGLTWPC